MFLPICSFVSVQIYIWVYSLAAIKTRNREIGRARLYHGQADWDASTANVRYVFRPGDSSRLYQKQSRVLGVELRQPAEVNVHTWLDPTSSNFKPEMAKSIFYYRGRMDKNERFKICIQTEEMKEASWLYAHDKQVVLDGTFGICDCRILLFIALAVDADNKGVPLALFLFSAPTGNQATHAGYDIKILMELLHAWCISLGERDGAKFAPKVGITDTDTKERAAMLAVWPSITLLLCKFHLRQCWTNRRKTLLKMGKTFNFSKTQVQSRLRALEEL
jgi:hypothetical protein